MEVCLRKEVKNRISAVEEGSIAQGLGICIGDELIAINGRAVTDIIDYIYLTADESITLDIRNAQGELKHFKIQKEFYDEVGLDFENPIMDEAKSCRNKCAFCFIDQMPEGMRETLYFKDDDSRLSFLQGNFVTLTNVSEADLDRMIEYRISPINVSVHTTDPELRVKMLHNRFAGDIMTRLERLAEARIEVNAQIVLCPEINDKAALTKTLKDLATLSPWLVSVAIVPVGLTKFRDGLAPLRGFTSEEAKEVIEQVTQLQAVFLEELDTRFAFLSDEFYIMANLPLPAYDAYEGFIQLENGVGLMCKFETELTDALEALKIDNTGDVKPQTATLFTGYSASAFMEKQAEKIKEKLPLTINVVQVDNDFFGRTITVAGLIVGSDIVDQSKDLELGDFVIIPRSMMKADEDIFLDNMTVEGFSQALGRPVLIAEVDGQIFLDQMINALTNDIYGGVQ